MGLGWGYTVVEEGVGGGWSTWKGVHTREEGQRGHTTTDTDHDRTSDVKKKATGAGDSHHVGGCVEVS